MHGYKYKTNIAMNVGECTVSEPNGEPVKHICDDLIVIREQNVLVSLVSLVSLIDGLQLEAVKEPPLQLHTRTCTCIFFMHTFFKIPVFFNVWDVWLL